MFRLQRGLSTLGIHDGTQANADLRSEERVSVHCPNHMVSTPAANDIRGGEDTHTFGCHDGETRIDQVIGANE